MMKINSTEAVLDACVLYPPGLRNLLMWLAVEEIYVPRWTDAIHEEWMRNVLEADAKKNDPPRLDRAKLNRTRALMDQNAPRSLVVGYERWIDTLTLPDPDDRHVLAAAIESGAAVIVTFNNRDFPKTALAPYGVEAVKPDMFLCRLFDTYPERFMAAVAALLETLKSPPMRLEELRSGYLKLGLSGLVERLKSRH